MSDRDKQVNDRLAARLVETLHPTSVLDVGSRYPYLLKCFLQRGIETVRGIDGCTKALEYGKELGVPMAKGDFLTHNFGDDTYDLVTAVHVIEHFADPRLAVRKLKEVLKPGGSAFIRTPCTDGDVGCHLHYKVHPVLFNEASLSRLLTEEGFLVRKLGEPCDGQIDILATLDNSNKCVNPIMHQWTWMNPHGDYYRRSYHFYDYPFCLAAELDWLAPVHVPSSVPGVLDLPPRPPLLDIPELKKDYVVIAHETGGLARRWDPERWKRVAEWIERHSDYSVIILGKSPLGVGTDLSGKLTVLESMAVIEHAKLVISADTVAPHIAAALNVPAIVLMGPADDSLTYPYCVIPVYRPDGQCTRCYHARENDKPYVEGQQKPIHHSCDWRKSACMEAISVGAVIDAIEQHWNREKRHRRLLSVCMIVKNEEASIMDAIRSVETAADEIVVVDTGSTDGTMKEAGKHRKVVRHSYRPDGDSFDDFAAARNFAFSKARGRYVMWLDAGDRVTYPQLLRKAVRSRLYDVIRMNTIYGDLVYPRERVVLRDFARFVDRVHETMPVHGLREIMLRHCSVQHIWQQKKGREPSLERNVRLLKMMIGEHGEGHERYPRWAYYLARDLHQSGRLEEARFWYELRLRREGFYEERFKAAIAVPQILLNQKQYLAAIAAAYEGLKVCDGYRELYYFIGDAYFWLGDYVKAKTWFHHALEVPQPSTVLGVWKDVYTYLPQCQLSYCYERLEDVGKALYWAKEELAVAPLGHHARIKARIVQFEQQLGTMLG